MKHYLVHFKNGLFGVVNGDSILSTLGGYNELSIYTKGNTGSVCVASFFREAVVGYQEVCADDAARYRLFWADLQLARVAKLEEGDRE